MVYFPFYTIYDKVNLKKHNIPYYRQPFIDIYLGPIDKPFGRE